MLTIDLDINTDNLTMRPRSTRIDRSAVKRMGLGAGSVIEIVRLMSGFSRRPCIGDFTTTLWALTRWFVFACDGEITRGQGPVRLNSHGWVDA